MTWLKRLFSGSKATVATGPEFVYVRLPEDIQPLARGEKYEDPIIEALSGRGIGEVTGGGSQLGETDDLGVVHIEYCGIDLDAHNLPAVREVLRELLPALGAPIDTAIQFRQGGQPVQDRYTGSDWILAEPRTSLHPGFGV